MDRPHRPHWPRLGAKPRAPARRRRKYRGKSTGGAFSASRSARRSSTSRKASSAASSPTPMASTKRRQLAASPMRRQLRRSRRVPCSRAASSRLRKRPSFEERTRHCRLFSTSRQPQKRRLLRLPPKANSVSRPCSRHSSLSQRSDSRKAPMRSTRAWSVHSISWRRAGRPGSSPDRPDRGRAAPSRHTRPERRRRCPA